MASHVHALNNSPSHNKYSFPKQQRFVYSKPTYMIIYLEPMSTIYLECKEIKNLHLLGMEKDLYQT